MQEGSFFIVDVFAQKRFQGNQLAVVMAWLGLADQEMQSIAQEMNYSETTFIMSAKAGKSGFPVRIFTPKREVPFAGHPTLGTPYIIAQHVLSEQVAQITLDLKVGPIAVSLPTQEVRPEVLWMRQAAPRFGAILEPRLIAESLNLDGRDLDVSLPVQEVSTGLPFIIVGLKSLDAVRRAAVDRARYFRLIEKTEAKAILIFCRETYLAENDLNVRVFADYFGVPEDPATGSANGCLAAYLVKHKVLGQAKVEARVEQGHELGRPSLLLLRAQEKGGDIEVNVGGPVIQVAKGEFLS